ncbi:HesB/IscA family protein [Candidatus Deianiraea vastatrix]|uniref:Iron-binding protein IscA n=1 Tax=Candidatus Deianiraea vastatrix TaxID=2163644 RepID=A0A5B8XDG8_9RICK|nr:iron-sulfur cluster assembly accessory protein [Candidatus Deianiraea vastatrix]QED23362.1 Iron-binding protein IscA [Candidatus Deianiraea vastatrix]
MKNNDFGLCDLKDTGFVADIETPEVQVPLEFKNKIVNYFTVTDEALKRISEILEKRKKPSSGIKVSIRSKGCSGMAYKIEFADYGINLTDADEMLVTSDGKRIFIDIKASLFVIGMTMDYQVEQFKEGFVFINPNEKGKCGCGSSFYV